MPEYLRNETSVYNFILARNNISRISIHKVLREIIDSNKIIINRGRLLYLDDALFINSGFIVKD